MSFFNLNIRTLSTIFIVLLTFYLLILISIYGLSHFEDSEVNYLNDNFNESIPNIFSCNFNYFSLTEHLDKEGFEHIRFRKIISTDDECFGKVAYTGISPGTKFNTIERDKYMEFGVKQKLGYVLWLYEKNFLVFLLFFLILVIIQIKFVHKNFFIYFLLLIFTYSFINFDKHNMYINSAKHYFPNENVKNSSLMNNWFYNND